MCKSFIKITKPFPWADCFSAEHERCEGEGTTVPLLLASSDSAVMTDSLHKMSQDCTAVKCLM